MVASYTSQPAILQPDRMTGGSIQNTGCMDPNWILVRALTDGVIANAETVNEAQQINGVIDIRNCISLVIAIYADLQSLTSVDIIPEFSDDISGSGSSASAAFFRLPYMTYGSGKNVLTAHAFQILAAMTQKYLLIPIFNPGASKMRIITASAGTTTSSAALIKVGRGMFVPQAYYKMGA